MGIHQAENRRACIIIIGNEILSGSTADANLSFLGRRCDELGIPVAEARIIPDIEAAIVATVNACRARYRYVFTTGGIGPTHDDITTQSMAKAFDRGVERRPEAISAMDRFYEGGRLSEARLKMADIPVGATLIDNPVSGAPGFQLENVFVLPGVPSILQVMFEGITDRLVGGRPILTATVATALTEGTLATDLANIQSDFPEVTIGSYPYFKHGRLGVNLVMRGTDPSRLEAARRRICALIEGLGGSVLNPSP